jgi:hypothetical protein
MSKQAATFNGLNTTVTDNIPEVSASAPTVIYVRRNTAPGSLPANRSRYLPITLKLGMRMDGDGEWVTGHTMEELKQYKKLPILKRDPVTGKETINSDFCSEFIITITERGLALNLSHERDRLIYSILKTGSYPNIVVNPEVIENLPHTCDFYILDEQVVAQAKNKKFEVTLEALNKLNGLTQIQLTDFLVFYGLPTVNVTPEVAKAKMVDEVNKDPKKFLDLLSNQELLNQTILFKKCVEAKIIYIDSKSHGYVFNEVYLGATEQEAITKINDPKNDSLKSAIIAASRKR